jgi:hypothetical protein
MNRKYLREQQFSAQQFNLARAPVPGHQAPVRIHQGALPRAEEEYGPDHYVVCAVEPVNGSWQVDGGRAMSTAEGRLQGAKQAEFDRVGGPALGQG